MTENICRSRTGTPWRNFRNSSSLFTKKFISTLRVNLLSKKFLSYAAIFLGGLSLCLGFYCYLEALYLVDEILEGDALRELSIEEKTTIILRQAPESLEYLKKFVLHYSICPAVSAIHIFWSKEIMGADPPDIEIFKFTKTHSSVQFQSIAEFNSSLTELFELKTAGVLFLDPDVYVSCSDVSFAQSVWRSGSDASVGFFPRTHRIETPKGPNRRDWRVLGWSDVIMQRGYSLMLPAGLMLHKQYIYIWLVQQAAIYKTRGGTWHTIVQNTEKILQFLVKNPLCEDISIPVLASSLSPVPPIFVDIKVKIDSRVKLPKKARAALNGDQKSDCLSLAADALGLADLSFASHKSTKSKSHVFW